METRRRLLTPAPLSAFEGRARARAGQLAEARELLRPPVPPETAAGSNRNWLVSALNGEIAFAAGDLPAAERAFIAAEPENKTPFDREGIGRTIFLNDPSSRDGLARVRKARGDLRGAIEIYRKLITPDISSKWTAVVQPRYVLELARLLDKAGDTAGGRQQYKRFLDLWNRADPDLPELVEARQSIASSR